MDALIVAEYAAWGGAASIAAAGFELWDFTRKKQRWPWHNKKDNKKTKATSPSLGFWLCSNIVLRVALATLFVGLQAGAAWISNIGAAIVIGAGSTFAFTGVAARRDVGYVEVEKPDDASTQSPPYPPVPKPQRQNTQPAASPASQEES
ncbi:hypothetical protein [Nocardia sp. NPDC049149]|uniref:hypothetical protein n=1 Tax=Nocardia sp. NPDC049149 TaxID=3364315 RepID=UPI0037130000